jgi:hypothetical protein
MTDPKTIDHPPISNERKNEIANEFMVRISQTAFPGDHQCTECVTDIMLMILCKYRAELLLANGPLTKTRVNAEAARTTLNFQMMFLAAAEAQIERAPHLSQVN